MCAYSYTVHGIFDSVCCLLLFWENNTLYTAVMGALESIVDHAQRIELTPSKMKRWSDPSFPVSCPFPPTKTDTRHT